MGLLLWALQLLGGLTLILLASRSLYEVLREAAPRDCAQPAPRRRAAATGPPRRRRCGMATEPHRS